MIGMKVFFHAYMAGRKEIMVFMIKQGANDFRRLSNDKDALLYLIENGISIEKFVNEIPDIILKIQEFRGEIHRCLKHKTLKKKLPKKNNNNKNNNVFIDLEILLYDDLIGIINDYSLF